MKTKFMNSLWLVFIALTLISCTGNTTQLPPEIVASLNTYADQFDENSIFASIPRLCSQEPTALYWHEETKLWAVTCLMDINFPLSENMYGVVLLDGVTNKVIQVDHINATSQSALENIIAVDWVRK